MRISVSQRRQRHRPAGVPVSTHLGSVADRERMAALPAEIHAEHGAIHLLFNNAGVTISETFEDSSLEQAMAARAPPVSPQDHARGSGW